MSTSQGREEVAWPAIVGGELVYLLAKHRVTGEPVALGEFPHCRMKDPTDRIPGCEAFCEVTDAVATTRVECTRYADHSPPHVCHIERGLPLLAWTSEGRAPVVEVEQACGLCRRFGHRDEECPTSPANWPTPTSGGSR